MTPRKARQSVSVRVVSIAMAHSGEVIYTPETGYCASPEAQQRITRALLGLPTTPTQSAQPGAEQAKPA